MGLSPTAIRAIRRLACVALLAAVLVMLCSNGDPRRPTRYPWHLTSPTETLHQFHAMPAWHRDRG